MAAVLIFEKLKNIGKIYENRCENKNHSLYIQLSSYSTLEYHVANFMNNVHPLPTLFIHPRDASALIPMAKIGHACITSSDGA